MVNEGLKSRGSIFLVAVIMILATIVLGYYVKQSDFSALISSYFILFICYLGVYLLVEKKGNILFFIGLGVLLRFILVFAFPNLSDDIYRFIWDGNLTLNGINPFNHTPRYFNQKLHPPFVHAMFLFPNLNSPDYFTIYPPVCQAIFAVSCWIFKSSWYGSAVFMKTFLFAFECGSLLLIWKLLRHFQLPEKQILLYALNPLVIIEITGNLHFEGAMVFFLLLSIWFLVKKKYEWSAISIALSIASKLLPLIFLPFLIKRLGWKMSKKYFAITGITLLLLFMPLLNFTFLENFSNSLDLYFRKFEFNASIYYLLRWIGKLVLGYNLIDKIGPSLGMLVMASIFYWVYKEENVNIKNLFRAMLFAFCLYLFLATTIHPWYVILPIALCIFTSFRFPIIWSGLIMLTYINYSYEEYFESLWVVSFEYFVVFSYLIWEISSKNKPFTIFIVKKEVPRKRSC